MIEDIEGEHDRRAAMGAEEALALLAGELEAAVGRVEKWGIGEQAALLRSVMRPRLWPAPTLSALAAGSPDRFAQIVLDCFVRLASLDPEPRLRQELICDVRQSVLTHRLTGPVYLACAEALFSLAWSADAAYEPNIARLAGVEHDASDELVCRSLAATQDSDAAVDWLVRRPDWYWLGWGYEDWPVMDVVAMHSGRCSDAEFARLEDAILAFSPAIESPECQGFGQFELLTVLDRDRMSPYALTELMRLHSRFVQP